MHAAASRLPLADHASRTARPAANVRTCSNDGSARSSVGLLGFKGVCVALSASDESKGRSNRHEHGRALGRPGLARDGEPSEPVGGVRPGEGRSLRAVGARPDEAGRRDVPSMCHGASRAKPLGSHGSLTRKNFGAAVTAIEPAFSAWEAHVLPLRATPTMNSYGTLVAGSTPVDGFVTITDAR